MPRRTADFGRGSWNRSKDAQDGFHIARQITTVWPGHRGDVYRRELVGGKEIVREQSPPLRYFVLDVPLRLLNGAHRVAQRVQQRDQPESSTVDAADGRQQC